MSKVFKAVGDFVGGAVKAVVKAVSSVVKAVVNVVSSVINFVAQPFMGLLGGMPDMPNAAAEADRQQGVLIQRTGSNVNIPVIYGYRKVGGIVTFAETGSTNNRYLYVAYVFSEGIVEGLRRVYGVGQRLVRDERYVRHGGRCVYLSRQWQRHGAGRRPSGIERRRHSASTGSLLEMSGRAAAIGSGGGYTINTGVPAYVTFTNNRTNRFAVAAATDLDWTDGTVVAWVYLNGTANTNYCWINQRSGITTNTRFSLHANPSANTIGIYNGTDFNTASTTIDNGIWYC